MTTKDELSSKDESGASVVRRPQMAEVLNPRGRFEVVCFDKDGKEKWRDTIDNLVTTVGKNEMLEEYMEGAAYTTSMFMGLKGTGSAAAGDTQASHAGWLEVGLANAPAYSGTRPVPSFGAAAAGVKATDTAAVFNITSAGTVAGCFINQGGTSAIDNTTGVLFSAGDFTGGNKVVDNLDTLNVTYSLAL
jgi:hypothetical protein